MKRVRTPLAVACVFILAVMVTKLSTNSVVVAATAGQGTPNTVNGIPVIRMVNFNPGSVPSPDNPIPKWQGIANYLAGQNVELLLLQEPAKRELDAIQSAFASQFPYMTYIKSRSGGELNPILSRYPFIEGSQQEWEINDIKKRVVLSIKVQTPYGILRAVNLHTHGDYQCKDAYNALEPIANPNSQFYNSSNQEFIMAGDFNIKLRSNKPYHHQIASSGSLLLESVCYKNTDYTQRLSQLIRLNYKANCLDVNKCQNVAAGTNENIEMVWSMVNNPIDIYQMWDAPAEIANRFNDANRHPIVFADIGDPNWKMPSSSLKPGDLDNDSDVDVFDYNILMNAFGTTGSPGFHSADINKNGVIDIFDYNELVKQL